MRGNVVYVTKRIENPNCLESVSLEVDLAQHDLVGGRQSECKGRFAVNFVSHHFLENAIGELLLQLAEEGEC